MQNAHLIVLPAKYRTFCDTSGDAQNNEWELLGPLPRHHGLSPARLPEGDGFFGFDSCLVNVKSTSNGVGRVEVTRLWLEKRFQKVLIDLTKDEVVLQHGRNQRD